MKTKLFLNLLVLIAVATLSTGCIIRERGGPPRYYHHHDYGQVEGHIHGPGCGHVLREGVWVEIH